jgi:Fe-S-cluster containining protein
MERSFKCTACGKCCFGWLPLTLKDALTHANKFPLAVIWTPVKQASKSFNITARQGLAVMTRDKKRLAVRISPTSYLPPSMPCPALASSNLCHIHAEKPSRCRTMPFFPYRDESDQTEMLIPRPGWDCDTSSSAPVVYRDKKLVLRGDFDQEQADLLEQTPVLRAYGEWVLKNAANMLDNLGRAAMKPGGGHVAVSFASLLRRLEGVDKEAIAKEQIAVLAEFINKTTNQAAMAEYRRNYEDWSWEMERLVKK